MPNCPECGADLGQSTTVCPKCGTALGPAISAPSPGSRLPSQGTGVCPNCKTKMTREGDLQFRVGGSTGGVGMLLGNWNQLSENIQPFSVYHCPTCGRIDLYESGR
jgi:Double zinc ribbon